MSEIAKLLIDEKLPSLNDYIAKINRNKHIGNKFKHDVQERINWYIRASKIKPIKCRVDLDIYWHEKTKRRDVDNIYSAIKYLGDSLQIMGIIENDSQRFIRNIHNYLVEDKKDYVIVIFKEAL
mgnify:FL=1